MQADYNKGKFVRHIAWSTPDKVVKILCNGRSGLQAQSTMCNLHGQHISLRRGKRTQNHQPPFPKGRGCSQASLPETSWNSWSAYLQHVALRHNKPIRSNKAQHRLNQSLSSQTLRAKQGGRRIMLRVISWQSWIDPSAITKKRFPVRNHFMDCTTKVARLTETFTSTIRRATCQQPVPRPGMTIQHIASNSRLSL